MKIYKNDSGFSMSPRAEIAYSEGKLPLSKITQYELDKHGIAEPLTVVKFLIQTKVIKPCEKHHTSKMINLTPFYDLSEIKNLIQSLSDEDLTAFRLATKAKNKTAALNVTGKVTLFEGKTKNYQTPKLYVFEGEQIGGWINFKKIKRIDLKKEQELVNCSFKKKFPSRYIELDK